MRDIRGFIGPEGDTFLSRMTDLFVQNCQDDQGDDLNGSDRATVVGVRVLRLQQDETDSLIPAAKRSA